MHNSLMNFHLFPRILSRIKGSLFRFLASYLLRYQRYVVRILSNASWRPKLSYEGGVIYSDVIRRATLDGCAHEIDARSVPGCIAELGVYHGDFAAQLNILFPKRILYLFDTFRGFDHRDVRNDDIVLPSSFMVGKFSDTSEKIVMSKMAHPEMCKIMAGHFPGTSINIDEQFALVSIDADLFEPIYEGLRFFYPRLSRGGYILIHDFNNKDWPGVAAAVRRYCEEGSIGYVPMPDVHGTVILSK